MCLSKFPFINFSPKIGKFWVGEEGDGEGEGSSSSSLSSLFFRGISQMIGLGYPKICLYLSKEYLSFVIDNANNILRI